MIAENWSVGLTSAHGEGPAMPAILPLIILGIYLSFFALCGMHTSRCRPSLSAVHCSMLAFLLLFKGTFVFCPLGRLA